MTDDQLDLVETQALIDALKRRSTIAVVVLMNTPFGAPKDGSDELVSDTTFQHKGNALTTQGCLDWALDRVKQLEAMEYARYIRHEGDDDEEPQGGT